MIKTDSTSEEGNMAKGLPDFPELFDKIGYFLIQFNKLRKERPSLTPDRLAAEFDRLVKSNSPSPGEEALDAWDELVETIYSGRLGRSCPSGSTKMGG